MSQHLPRYLIVNFKKKRRPWSLPSVCFGLLADTVKTQMGQVKRSAAYPSQTSQQPYALQPALHSSQRVQNVLMLPLCVRQIAFPLLSLPSSGMHLPFNSTGGLCYLCPMSMRFFTNSHKVSTIVRLSITVIFYFYFDYPVFSYAKCP